MRILSKIFLLFSLLMMISCCQSPDPTVHTVVPETIAAKEVIHTISSVTASGVIVPESEARLSFSQSGWIKELELITGEDVQQGDMIAQLEGLPQLEALLAAANTEVISAQQALDELSDNYAVAKANAYSEIVAANHSLGQVQSRLYYFDIPVHLAKLNSFKALEKSITRLEEARENYRPYLEQNKLEFRRAGKKDKAEEQAEDELEWAQSDYNNSLRRLEIEAELVNAESLLAQAEKTYANLQDGPDPDQMAMAQARLEQAQAELKQAQSALDQIVLYAPFDGTVVSVDASVGETVLPGQVVVVIGDLEPLHVETSDLSERDISEIAVGQEAQIYIEALNHTVDGLVTSIAPQSNTIGGDVVYTVNIQLNEEPEGLRWGMSTEVKILLE